MKKLLSVGIVALIALSCTSASFAQPGGGRRGGMGGFGGGRFGGMGSPLALVRQESVQTDLGISEDQVTKLTAIADDTGKAVADQAGDPPGRDADPKEREDYINKRTAATREAFEKAKPKILEVISAEQLARLQEISFQVAGTRSLQNPDLVKSLALSQDQQDKLAALFKDYDAKLQELFPGRRGQGGGGGGGGGNPGDFRAKMEDMNKERDAKATDILSAEQKDKFAKAKGKEFDVSSIRFGFGGGGRGGQGGPGGPNAQGGTRNRPGRAAQDPPSDTP